MVERVHRHLKEGLKARGAQADWPQHLPWVLLNIKGIDKRVVFQGVHMLMGSDAGTAWKPGEKRESKMVFIGRDMPKDVLLDGLAQCVAGARQEPLQ